MRLGTLPESPIEAAGMAVPGLVPRSLFECYFAPMMARTIMAGVSLGIFEALAEQPDDAAGLARRLELDPAGVDALLIALHSQRYLERRDGGYRNGAEVRRHLLASSPQPLVECMGGFTYDMWNAFSQLEETVRSGEQLGLHEGLEPEDPFWERYMRGLRELADLRAGAVTRLIAADSPRKLLDLAGGHGGYSIAMCRRHPGLEATVLELEGAARVGRAIVAEAGMEDRVTFEVGDIFTSELGAGYDVAMANSILHHFDPERDVELLRRARGALRPGGTMAVVEQERPPDGKRGTQIGALTGMLFYITSKVRTYTAEELRSFLERAGFEGVRARRHVTAPGIVVVVGRVPEHTG